MSGRADLAARYGPVAVVTGATSGIGRAIATELAGEGLRRELARPGSTCWCPPRGRCTPASPRGPG